MYKQQGSISKGVDWFTIILFIVIACVGLISIYSVEYKPNDNFFDNLFSFKNSYSKQFYFLLGCGVVAIFIMLTDSKFFTATANLLYLIGLVLMLATIFIGKNVNGSKSWIPLGFMNLQPVELSKIFTALALAKFLSQPETDFTKPRNQLIAAAIAFSPIAFSLLQNETGLALVYFAFLIPMYREGLPAIYLIAGAGLAMLLVLTLLLPSSTVLIIVSAVALVILFFMRRKIKNNKGILLAAIGIWGFCAAFSGVVVPFLFKHVFQQYQADRIFSMLGKDNPYVSSKKTNGVAPVKKPVSKDKENYNVRQSKIAIGSGGFAGKGYLQGTQTQGDFVPEQRTDFIFTSVGENFGFWGTTLVLILYLALLLRLVTMAERQRSTFSRVYIYAVAAIFFFHIGINIGMTIGLAPVIGITLPLMSYGGSSLLTFTILIFTAVTLDADRQMVLR